MKKGSPAEHLPNYKGLLGPAPWSSFTMTPEIRSALAEAALDKCPTCSKKGWIGTEAKPQVCHCVNRRTDLDRAKK